MPTQRERDYYRAGFTDGLAAAERKSEAVFEIDPEAYGHYIAPRKPKPKRKLSAWNKFVKANSKKPRFRYRNGKLNLKKMAVAFRKTPAGKKKRR